VEATQGGLDVRDVSEAVRVMGYWTERIAAYDNEESVLSSVPA